VANVTAALKAAGMYQHTVMILISDNVIYLCHACFCQAIEDGQRLGREAP
jgi:hypothetical protein